MLVGNKLDLEAERVVLPESGRKTAEKWGTGKQVFFLSIILTNYIILFFRFHRNIC